PEEIRYILILTLNQFYGNRNAKTELSLLFSNFVPSERATAHMRPTPENENYQLFLEDPLPGIGLFHGEFTHAFQLAVLFEALRLK
ncbi:hypothetical protein ABTM22_20300, partial [Acinetobacter baumannii]